MDYSKINENFEKWLQTSDFNERIKENEIINKIFELNLTNKYSKSSIIIEVDKEKINESSGLLPEIISDNLSLYIKIENNSVTIIGKILFVKELGGRIGYAHGAGIGYILNISNSILIDNLDLNGYVLNYKKLQFLRKTNIFSLKLIVSELKYKDKHMFITISKLIDYEDRPLSILEVEYKFINVKF
jgi:hypothetical protein